MESDLQKTGSCASAASGHFFINTAILRKFLMKNPALLTADERRISGFSLIK